jgi:hydrogenase/urease accessory protein HupE
MARLLKRLKDPRVRFWAATALFVLTLILGTLCTLFVAQTPYERVLMAISWGAITITCLDIMATTDVRKEQ